VVAARGPQRGDQLPASQLRCPRRARCTPEQPQRVLGGQVLEGLDSGGKEFQQRRAQPQHVPGPFPNRALMYPRQQLHCIGQVAVSDDRAVVIAVEAHDLSQHMSIAGVAFGTGGGAVPLPVARD
jgi:hypothetical protein